MEEEKESPEMKKYFEYITQTIDKAYTIAGEARKKGFDPEKKVDIPRARNIAERVTGLISVAYPPIAKTNVSKRIQELEKKYGNQDWRIALQIAEEVAKEKHCKFPDKIKAMEVGIRLGIAYVTNGVVASPLEGFSHLLLEKTKEGKEYFKIYYSGPIRSAGGTGASVSVLIADYVRKKMGYAPYDPSEEEVKRYITELYDYHERITNLQYLPSEEEIEFLAKNIPVQIAGDPSEKIEVSNYKDLERVETNRIRNGICLVIGEGIAQKAPKLWKQLSKWGNDFDMDQWNFLQDFINVQKRIKAKKETKKEESEEEEKISPDYTFIKDLVAGRPVLTHPLAAGGFRLRFGRARTSGYSSNAIHPVTMKVLNSFIAIGTQLKVERPGKGCTVSSCDNIEGPIVKLKDQSVKQLDTEKEFESHKENIEEILFLGDMLINYGDFLNRAHVLVPPGYCEEWWVQEMEKAIVDSFGSLDIDKLSEMTGISSSDLDKLLKEPLKTRISAKGAIMISQSLKIPLHPYYTYHWNLLSLEDLKSLIQWFDHINIKKENDEISKIILPYKEEQKRHLELAGLPHIAVNKEFVVIEKDAASAFAAVFNISEEKDIKSLKKSFEDTEKDSVLDFINSISEIMIRDKSGIFIGARMGRPEKAKLRKLTGSPQVLFPVGKEGGRLRCFQAALEKGTIISDFPLYHCSHCNKSQIFAVCTECGKKTDKKYACEICGLIDKPECSKHGPASSFKTQEIDIKDLFRNSLKKLDMRTYPDLIKGVRGTSNKDHIPEHITKGIIRSKHDLYVNKDGTIRYDMTQMPITHFKPKEISTSIEKLKELGYILDIKGKPLESSDQILEIKPQDIILPACEESPELGADKIMFKTAAMCDEMLEKLYSLKPYYNASSSDDVVGHIALALAPHTSAAIATRIIGFSSTQGFLAHPVIHAATRRDCDGDEASISLLMDALLNFSRQYLPAHKGATQDAPLVMTSLLTPSEVDDMIFDMDIVPKYGLEFYKACLEYKYPWDIDIEKFGDNLGKAKQYEGMLFTHDTENFNKGVQCSAYKVLPTMEEKMKGQMEIAEKARAVDTSDVARLVIEKHFIRDTKGNLRKFSMQQFRCVKCNEKFRRPPLMGKCSECGGRIIFTISEGSVIKYLEPSISLANKYNVPDYLKQSLELVKRRIEGVFGKEKEKQTGLGAWFG
ncbi:DNA polymerase II large subunit [Candidatus Woesearchaeota archaeon]|nr:DNA polymerase II large subunit [Candidatus Woesearchaeota archaeon]